MERYLGLDMHRDSCTAVVLSAGGKKTGEQVMATETAALVQYIKSLSGELHVCVEEGEWSEWVVEILNPWVSRVVSASAPGRKGPRSDAMDARELAERLRTRQTGPPVYKASREWARLREAVPPGGQAAPGRGTSQAAAQESVSTSWCGVLGRGGLLPAAARAVAREAARKRAAIRRAPGSGARSPHRAAPDRRAADVCSRWQVSDVAQAPDGSGDRPQTIGTTASDRGDPSSLPHQTTLLVLLRTRCGHALDLGLGPPAERSDGAGSSDPGPGAEQSLQPSAQGALCGRREDGSPLPATQSPARRPRTDGRGRDQTESGPAHHRAKDRCSGAGHVEERKRVSDHELSLTFDRFPAGLWRRAPDRDGDRCRVGLRDPKVEGESPLSSCAPSSMGVTDISLGPLPGPKEEMAHEALMEGWSQHTRTHTLTSHLTSSPATGTDPRTGRRLADPLGRGIARARSQDLERSGKLRLDIDFYGRRQLADFGAYRLSAIRVVVRQILRHGDQSVEVSRFNSSNQSRTTLM